MKSVEEQRRLELERAVADLKTRVRRLEQAIAELMAIITHRDLSA